MKPPWEIVLTALELNDLGGTAWLPNYLIGGKPAYPITAAAPPNRPRILSPRVPGTAPYVDRKRVEPAPLEVIALSRTTRRCGV